MYRTHGNAGMSELGKRRRDNYDDGSVGMRRTGYGGTKAGYSFVSGGTQMSFNYPNAFYRYTRPRSSSGVPSGYRGYFRRSGFYGRYTTRNQVARVRRGLNIEKKFFDTANTFTFDATGEVPASGQLALIPQGVTESTRVGRKCTVTSIQIRASVYYVPAADTVGAEVAYLYLVLDRQANGAAAGIADVLTGTGMGVAMINLANSERFKILKRFVIPLQAGAGVQTAFGRDDKPLDFYKKCKIPLEFSGITGAITELKSNNIFFLAGTDGGGDDNVQFTGTTRLRFTDL